MPKLLLIPLIFLLNSSLCDLIRAAEVKGTVKSSGVAVPGATVTASQASERRVTTTDGSGQYRFADLAQGAWDVRIEMLGFAAASRTLSVGATPIASDVDLRLLSETELIAALAPTRTTESPVTHPQPPASARNETNPATATTGGRPTGRPQTGAAADYRRLTVNQAPNTGTFGTDTAIKTEEAADLSQSAANAFIVQGSLSTGLNMPRLNDWGPPGGGMEGPGGMGPGGAGMAGGLGDDTPMGPQGGLGARAAGAGFAGGPGGGGPPPGGGGPGGGGPGMGGGPGGGGPGGMGGGPGGMGGPGGPGGPDGMMMGRGPGGGRPDWMGRPNASAFGNNRRNPNNLYMGSASFSLDNSALNARSYSVTGAAVDKPAYANARAGLMFGGPLWIPKLIARERRIMFTINFEMQRSRTGTISDAVNVPTALERIGDFSQTTLQGSAVTITDPLSGSAFPGNKIPVSRLNAAALALLNYYPTANLPYSARNYQTSWTGHSNSYNLNSRLSNIKLTSKDRLNFGIGYQKSDSETPNLFQFLDTGSGSGVNSNLGWSRTIRTTLVNSVQLSYSHMRQQSSPYFAGTENIAEQLGILGTSQNPMNWGPPNLSFTNYTGLSDGNASLSRNQTVSVSESLSWTKGTHNFSFGGGFRRMQFNQFADQNGRGSYSFNGSSTGYDLADFLLGTPSTASLRYGNPDKYFRASNVNIFVNDDWRINAKFSINGGVRWDYATPVTELYNRLVNLVIAPGFGAVTLVQASQAGNYSLPASLVRPDRNNFAPRIGMAWRPQSNRSLVIRAGYGMYYNTSVYNIVASNMAQQAPFAQVLSASNSTATPLTIERGFLLASSATASSTYAVDPNYRIGYAQTWTLTLQHDLPLGMFATAGYLGTKGTRLDQQFLPNSVAPGATESTLTHNYTYETSNGNSIYHAAQFQLNRRFRTGIGARASYQFSKSIDNAGTGGRGQGNTPVAQDWLDLSAERGLSSFDSRHNLSLQLQYSTGMGTSGGTLVNGWKGALFKDWNISGNINARSGTPMTATVGGSGSQVSGTAVSNTLRADATGLAVAASGVLFNTAAFSTPASGMWGNAGRNTIPGPSTFYLNASVGRIFRPGERRSADLQVQAQNLLNHVVITNWGTVLDSANYGLATGAAGMRRISINLRFRF